MSACPKCLSVNLLELEGFKFPILKCRDCEWLFRGETNEINKRAE